jgi:hypothetical protein
MFLLVFGLSSSVSGLLLVSVAPDESEGEARQTHKDEEENRRPNPKGRRRGILVFEFADSLLSWQHHVNPSLQGRKRPLLFNFSSFHLTRACLGKSS